MMTTNLFVIANVKQLWTDGSFRSLLPSFPRISWCVGVLNSAIFNSFHNRVEFGPILEALRNFGGGGVLNPPQTYPRYATAQHEHYSISILVLIYFFHFRFNALCLAAVCYNSSYLFHYIYGRIIFGLGSLFQEHDEGVQQGLDVGEDDMSCDVKLWLPQIARYLVHSCAVPYFRCAVTARIDWLYCTQG